MKNFQKNNQGFSIIEATVGVAVSAVLLMSFVTIILQSQKISRENLAQLSASLYAREALEVAKDLEQTNWDELTKVACMNPNPCHPGVESGKWVLEEGDESLESGAYTRSISWFGVERSATSYPNDIVSTGGINDPNTRKVVVEVTWQSFYGEKNEILESYVYQFPE